MFLVTSHEFWVHVEIITVWEVKLVPLGHPVMHCVLNALSVGVPEDPNVKP